MSHLKLSLLLIAGVLTLAPYSQAAMPNLAMNPRFITAPSDPVNYVAENWAYYNTGTAIVTRLAPGLRITSAGATGASTTAKGASQVIAGVVAGKTYQVDGQWRGNLSIATAGNARVDCGIDFSSDGGATWGSGFTRYRKHLQYNYARGCFNIPGYTPSMTDYTWDWENLSNSVYPWVTPSQDTIVVPAGMTLMRVQFSLSTVTQPSTLSWIEVDYVTVTACQGAIAGDVNGDCKVTFADFAVQAASWLACGMTPSSFCP